MNNSNQQVTRSIGIFRAMDVRVPHIEFAAAFKQFNASFVSELNPKLQKVAKSIGVKTYDIPLRPRFVFDPVYPLLRKTDFTPWVHFDNQRLATIISEFSVFEIYEPYFFYSSQIADHAEKNQVPLITEIWTSFPEHPSLYFPPYNLLVKNVVKKTDLFVLRSERAHSYLTSFKIPKSKTITLYHGVNLSRFTPQEKKHDGTTILFVGALASHKGLDDLLEVFPSLVEKYPGKLRLLICGEGPLRENVIHLANRLPIDYRGEISNEDLPTIYQASDIYCQPSKDYYFLGIKGGEEFAGYTFMEALGCGLPIVATYCGGIPEIVGPENRLITQGKKQELYEALDAYIAEPNKRVETGKKNRLRAEKLFDITKQTNLLERAIKERLA